MGKPLILLDRDGVLNRLVVDAEQGTVDSPLHPSQVEMLPGVADALALLTQAGYGLAVVTNQPAAAKKKTTHANLEAVQQKVLTEATRLGGKILSSHMCLHRAEDGCSCRKPKPGMLWAAFAQNPDYHPSVSWMVGDGVTDIQAGMAVGLRTAFLGSRKCDVCKIMEQGNLQPTYWAADLTAFTTYLLGDANESDDFTHEQKPACQGVR
jgi:D-glycero-D-manno-heptose 1,7-bisphosphate phosphatase